MTEIDFDSATPPSQEQFDDYHEEPVDYGEDGDQLLSFKYTKEEAVKKFTDHWTMLSGEKPDFNVAECVTEGSAGWALNPDKYDGGTFTFVWLNGDSDTRPIYNAWLLWM